MDHRPFILRKWSPLTRMEQARLSSIPIWIRLLNLPLHLWEEDCLSRIGSLIGNPLYADSATMRCSRASSTRICVEIQASHSLSDSVLVVVSPGIRESFKVDYDWKPTSSSTVAQAKGKDKVTQWQVVQKNNQANKGKLLSDAMKAGTSTYINGSKESPQILNHFSVLQVESVPDALVPGGILANGCNDLIYSAAQTQEESMVVDLTPDDRVDIPSISQQDAAQNTTHGVLGPGELLQIDRKIIGGYKKNKPPAKSKKNDVDPKRDIKEFFRDLEEESLTKHKKITVPPLSSPSTKWSG
ncbi:hypothetical protein QJS10_CPA05g01917 [Acorus calamus]|uniref:DUF4283 domain-containing protein n=1 Tax=Acorus calamus TaxID=4465 RepID=A0AAV9ERC1_ACOCL|nr:hypothetical protein QJS10_CPA05g01917 [Acorus calamus]